LRKYTRHLQNLAYNFIKDKRKKVCLEGGRQGRRQKNFQGGGKQKDQNREIAPMSPLHFISCGIGGVLGMHQGLPQGNAASRALRKVKTFLDKNPFQEKYLPFFLENFKPFSCKKTLNPGPPWPYIACLHDQNKSGFFGGPAFIQPIRAIPIKPLLFDHVNRLYNYPCFLTSTCAAMNYNGGENSDVFSATLLVAVLHIVGLANYRSTKV